MRELRRRQDEERRAAGQESPPMRESPSLKHKVVDDFMKEQLEVERQEEEERIRMEQKEIR